LWNFPAAWPKAAERGRHGKSDSEERANEIPALDPDCKMTGIDTNVLVRYLAEDDAEQARRVNSFLKRSRMRRETIFISVIALCETVWVLESALELPKREVLDAIEGLLGVDVFQVEAEDAVRTAVERCRAGRGGLADHLIGALNLSHGCRHTVTFDRELRSAPGFVAL
jgi:predicted nucleic-acid-binding protein